MEERAFVVVLYRSFAPLILLWVALLSTSMSQCIAISLPSHNSSDVDPDPYSFGSVDPEV